MTRNPSLYLWCSVVSTKYKVSAKVGFSEVVARLVVLATSKKQARAFAQQVCVERSRQGETYCGVPVKMTATRSWPKGRKATRRLPL